MTILKKHDHLKYFKKSLPFMSRLSRIEIIDPDLILNQDDIRSLNFTDQYIEDVFSSKDSALKFLASIRLIPNTLICIVCNQSKTLTRKLSLLDGFVWCCRSGCTDRKTVRFNSYFYDSKKSLKVLFKLIYKLSANYQYDYIARDLGIHRNTSSMWSKIIREACIDDLMSRPRRIGGYNSAGNQLIVEIDESYFFKRKYNRGKLTRGTWYVCGVERGTKRSFMVPVPNRNRTTIAAVIIDNVLPGTRIITDEWRAYRAALNNMSNYDHDTVNHSVEFVSSDDPTVHTQTIEGFFSQAKKFLRSRNGISKSEEYIYLIQFMWQYSTEKELRFNEIINIIKCWE